MKKIVFLLMTLSFSMLFHVESIAIVGGTIESGHDAVGAFSFTDSSICGGTLITDKWVITAAQCFDGTDVDSFIIGENISSPDAIYSIASVHMHPLYSGTDNDIALVRLSFPVDGVTPIPINTNSNAVSVGDAIQYIGYGVTDPDVSDGGSKRSAIVEVTDIMSHLIVTNSSSSGPCIGDSGAPCLIENPGTYIAGIAYLWDIDCNINAYCTRVAEYTGFINDVMAATDTEAPQFQAGYPSVQSLTETGFDIVVQLDEPGSVYYTLVAGGSTAPSEEDIISGTGGLQHGTITVSSASTSFSTSLSGLTAETEYDFYCIAGDNETGPNYQDSSTKIDITTLAAGDIDPPDRPVISSSTHPNENTWYSSDDPSFTWTTPFDSSGIAGYSYLLDMLPTTTPDTTIDTIGTSASGSDLANGEWYLHVSAMDNAGNWGAADHYRVRIDDIPPAISPISNASIIEGTPYNGPTPSLTQAGPSPVTWSLVSGPSGMLIESGTGIVSWANPTASGSPHQITIRVNNTAGFDDESWQLVVTSNHPPILNPIGNKSVVEGDLLEFTIIATDPDGDNMSCSAVNLPQGATFTDQGNGSADFSWQTESGDAGVYDNIIFTVVDSGNTSLSASENVTITVSTGSNNDGGGGGGGGGCFIASVF